MRTPFSSSVLTSPRSDVQYKVVIDVNDIFDSQFRALCEEFKKSNFNPETGEIVSVIDATSNIYTEAEKQDIKNRRDRLHRYAASYLSEI